MWNGHALELWLQVSIERFSMFDILISMSSLILWVPCISCHSIQVQQIPEENAVEILLGSVS